MEEIRISPGLVIVGGLVLGLAAMLGLATVAWAAPPEVYPEGLTILGVSARRNFDGSITVYVRWVHQGLNWGLPGEFFVAGAYFGDAETNVWGLYMETIGDPTPEGVAVTTSIHFPWDFLTGMGEHPEEAYRYHDFKCTVTLYRDWQTPVASSEHIAEGVI